MRAKREIEEASEAMLQRGLPLVRLYPGLCLGPGDRTGSSSGVVRAWQRGHMPALVRGGICFVDVRDAAQAHLAVLEQGAVGEQYLFPGSNLTHRAFFAALAEVAGKRPLRWTVPHRLGIWGAALLERVMAVPPLRRDEARLMGRRWWYADDAPALGLRYRPLVETLRMALVGK